MLKMSRMRKILVLGLLLTTVSAVSAETAAKPIQMKAETTVANMDMVVKDNFVKAK